MKIKEVNSKVLVDEINYGFKYHYFKVFLWVGSKLANTKTNFSVHDQQWL